jgi:DNA (cytosine-5)-methyltransferase 1
VDEFWRLILEIGANGFLFENVPSITHPRNRVILDQLIEAAESAGYKVLLLCVNAVEYGVPQSRHRVALLGLRRGTPTIPETTHAAMTGHSFKAAPVTAGEALAPYSDRDYFEPEEVVTGRWVKQLHEIPPGQNYKALTAWAGHTRPVFEAETRFWNFLLKLHPDLPSWTIAANPGPWVGPFHWESRRLRTVELAALQSFPDGYQFAGNRRDRVRQIGNAVPALMAQKLIEPLVAALATELPRSRRKNKAEAPCDV